MCDWSVVLHDFEATAENDEARDVGSARLDEDLAGFNMPAVSVRRNPADLIGREPRKHMIGAIAGRR
jgi:hypothetical protein